MTILKRKIPKISLYPVANGNHNNQYFMVRIKDIVKMKALVDLTTETAYIINCNFVSSSIEYFLDKEKFMEALIEAFKNKDLKLIINDSIFIKRSTTEQTAYKDQLINTLTL